MSRLVGIYIMIGPLYRVEAGLFWTNLYSLHWHRLFILSFWCGMGVRSWSWVLENLLLWALFIGLRWEGHCGVFVNMPLFPRVEFSCIVAPVWSLYWILVVWYSFIHKTHQGQYFLVLGVFGGPTSRCEKVVVLFQGNHTYLFSGEILELTSLYHNGIHVVPEGWSWGYGVYIELMSHNFVLSLSRNWFFSSDLVSVGLSFICTV